MPGSKIKQLWVGGKVLKKLKSIVLCFSMLRTLDLVLTPNLVHLDLGYCYYLEELHAPVGYLKKLVHLDLTRCVRLKSFSFIKDLESLTLLDLSLLYLEEFPDIIPSHPNSSLQLFHFRANPIKSLPSSFGNLQKLVHLSLDFCTKLKSLPGSFCSLQQLRVLSLSVSGIEELPEDIGQLEYLEKLYLMEVKHLPPGICKLKNLKTLILGGCKVRKLPEDFGQIESLTKLTLSFCKIREIPSSICKLKHLKELDLSECSELEKLPENLGDLECLEQLILFGTPISHLPHSIFLLKGLRIFGYCPDELLFQGQL